MSDEVDAELVQRRFLPKVGAKVDWNRRERVQFLDIDVGRKGLRSFMAVRDPRCREAGASRAMKLVLFAFSRRRTSRS